MICDDGPGLNVGDVSPGVCQPGTISSSLYIKISSTSNDVVYVPGIVLIGRSNRRSGDRRSNRGNVSGDVTRGNSSRRVTTLNTEMSVRYVLWWDGLLIALHRLSLFFDLQVAQNGDEEYEDDEPHAAPDDQPQPSGQDAADAARIADGCSVADHNCRRRFQGFHLLALTHSRVQYLRRQRRQDVEQDVFGIVAIFGDDRRRQ